MTGTDPASVISIKRATGGCARRRKKEMMNRQLVAITLALFSLMTTAFAFQDTKTMTQEFFKAIREGDLATVRQLIATDPKLASARNEKGLSAVLMATYYRKTDVVAELIGTGIELDIFEASATGQAGRVRELLKRDAALANAFSPDGFFPLGLAVFFGRDNVFEILLAAGADVNAVTRESMKITALHSAVAAGRIAMARTLIARGANVNPRQAENGVTPLHEAAGGGGMELARLLLENGAEINARTKDGKTPLDIAISQKRSEMAAFLRERGGVQ